MTTVRRSYLEELARIRERVNSLFEEVLLRSGFPGGESGPPGTWAPTLDVVETDGAIIIHAELPGVGRDDVDVSVQGRRLELSGRRRPLPADRNFFQMERSYGPFRRTLELPSAIDADRVSAAFEAGVLTITLPKKAAGRTVPIETE